MIRRPPRSTHCISSAASDVYKRQVVSTQSTWAKFWRYAMPLILVINMSLFILSNATVAVQVRLKLGVGIFSEDIKMKTFNLFSSVNDMWQAKVYPLAFLIAGFSGIWPQVKLILMLCCWLIPPKHLNFKRRETLLEILDTMGKYSLIDTYVLVMMTVSFRYILNLDLVVTSFSINEVVRPQPSFYLFVVITLASLLWTHIIIHYHRLVEQPVQHFGDEKRSLGDIYSEKGNGVKRSMKQIMTIVIIVCLGLLIWGSLIKSFQFVFLGAAGWALGKNNTESFSLIELGIQLPHKTEWPNFFWIRFTQACYFLFGAVVPTIYLIVLFFLWIYPMRIKIQKLVFRCAEILNAWSALEVFQISLLASLLEIRQFAQFIIGSKCDPINTMLKKVDTMGIVNFKGDDKCFDVVNTLLTGCWLLFVSSVLYILIGTFLLRTCQSTLEKRIKQESDEQQQDEEIEKNDKVVKQEKIINGNSEVLQSASQIGSSQVQPSEIISNDNIQQKLLQNQQNQSEEKPQEPKNIEQISESNPAPQQEQIDQGEIKSDEQKADIRQADSNRFTQGDKQNICLLYTSPSPRDQA
eukprot:TRINITY_DN3756_c0_g1_i1.p1 TRINITY_DN3756_c0_g1~~TRINITY_DN3756_c0_g1_i1.p1  ORF type:complete len:579 (-),score=75.00 TRINITY_DN3756_c0_g1_i1:135-1871(-)